MVVSDPIYPNATAVTDTVDHGSPGTSNKPFSSVRVVANVPGPALVPSSPSEGSSTVTFALGIPTPVDTSTTCPRTSRPALSPKRSSTVPFGGNSSARARKLPNPSALTARFQRPCGSPDHSKTPSAVVNLRVKGIDLPSGAEISTTNSCTASKLPASKTSPRSTETSRADESSTSSSTRPSSSISKSNSNDT